jgi:hypothetical protein
MVSKIRIRENDERNKKKNYTISCYDKSIVWPIIRYETVTLSSYYVQLWTCKPIKFDQSFCLIYVGCDLWLNLIKTLGIYREGPNSMICTSRIFKFIILKKKIWRATKQFAKILKNSFLESFWQTEYDPKTLWKFIKPYLNKKNCQNDYKLPSKAKKGHLWTKNIGPYL